MKRLLSLLTIAAVVFSTPVWSHPTVDKAKDGGKTILMSPLHVRDGIKEEVGDRRDITTPFAAIGGLLKGGFYMGKDIVTGAYDVVTSPLEMVKK